MKQTIVIVGAVPVVLMAALNLPYLQIISGGIFFPVG